MGRGAVLSARDARWLAIEAQGLHRPRSSAAAGRAKLLATVDTMGMVQLDAINVLERTQLLTLFSRVGPFRHATFHSLSGPGRELFEYAGRVAALLPVSRQPLFRWKMAQAGMHGNGPKALAAIEHWRAANADYIATVLAEVTDRGPLMASELTDPQRRDGEWWGRRSVGRQVLEYLAFRGELVGWRTPTFARVYDRPERVLPPEVLAQPTPTVEEAHRQLLLLAAGSLGVGTVADLAAYYLVKTQAARPRVRELVEAGELVEVQVEGWKDTGFMAPAARPRRPTRATATLLSPFDLLIWERKRTARLFGFDYTIEVYVPEPKRVYGYFVLPMLLGDELVGRFDLKADRRSSALLVRGAYIEPEADPTVVADAAAVELAGLQRWLGLDRMTVARKGNLAPPLRRAVAAAT